MKFLFQIITKYTQLNKYTLYLIVTTIYDTIVSYIVVTIKYKVYLFNCVYFVIYIYIWTVLPVGLRNNVNYSYFKSNLLLLIRKY